MEESCFLLEVGCKICVLNDDASTPRECALIVAISKDRGCNTCKEEGVNCHISCCNPCWKHYRPGQASYPVANRHCKKGQNIERRRLHRYWGLRKGGEVAGYMLKMKVANETEVEVINLRPICSVVVELASG